MQRRVQEVQVRLWSRVPTYLHYYSRYLSTYLPTVAAGTETLWAGIQSALPDSYSPRRPD